MENFQHKKSLGQNFLKDKNILMKIIDSVKVDKDDLIIEIGPGQGALTKYLKLFNANLRCYEIDIRTEKYLEKYKDDKTEIVFKDFLQIDIKKELEDYSYKNLYVIANLPYYITSPIIEKLIDSKLKIQAMVFMVQNEVADRFAAKVGTKNYGFMTVYLNSFYDVSKLFLVKRNCFEPVPNVDSAVIKFQQKKQPLIIKNMDFYLNFVKDSFKMKRKNLKNNLRNYNLEIIENVLKEFNLSLQNRAEDIPIDCFVKIANSLSK